MRPALTQRQNEVFECVRAFLRQQGRPPTLQEVAQAVGIASPSAVRKHLIALERKGYLERQSGQARGLRLTDRDLNPLSVDMTTITLPVIGPATAEGGFLTTAYLRIDPYFLHKAARPQDCLLGTCTDDGMSASGIRKGDLLVIEAVAAHRLLTRALVAVRTGGELQAREIVRTQRGIRLQPSDRRYKPVMFDERHSHLVGRVLSVLRRM